MLTMLILALTTLPAEEAFDKHLLKEGNTEGREGEGIEERKEERKKRREDR